MQLTWPNVQPKIFVFNISFFLLWAIYLICLCHMIAYTIHTQEEETVWCLQEALIIVVWIIRYVRTSILDESDSTHRKNQSILLFDVSLGSRSVSVFLTLQSYHSEICKNYFLWSVLNSRNKLKHFYGNTLVWQWYMNSGEDSGRLGSLLDFDLVNTLAAGFVKLFFASIVEL